MTEHKKEKFIRNDEFYHKKTELEDKMKDDISKFIKDVAPDGFTSLSIEFKQEGGEYWWPVVYID